MEARLKRYLNLEEPNNKRSEQHKMTQVATIACFQTTMQEDANSDATQENPSDNAKGLD
jgi:hypothetical protein